MARVVLTTAEESLAGIEARLAQAGHATVRRPLIETRAAADPVALAERLAERLGMRTHAAVAVTSPRAARAIAECVGQGVLESTALPELWCAGAGTARALAAIGCEPRLPGSDAVGRRGAAVALAEAMLAAGVGAPVLFVRGEPSRDELPRMLRAAGVAVDELVAYHTAVAGAAALRAAAADADLLVVGSPLVAEALARALAPSAAPSGARRPALVALGPTTAEAARAAGWAPVAVAATPTVDGVAEAVGVAMAHLEITAPVRGLTSPA